MSGENYELVADNPDNIRNPGEILGGFFNGHDIIELGDFQEKLRKQIHTLSVGIIVDKNGKVNGVGDSLKEGEMFPIAQVKHRRRQDHDTVPAYFLGIKTGENGLSRRYSA